MQTAATPLPRAMPDLSTPPALASYSDAQLAAQAASGDRAAFECILRRHNRLLFRTARSVLKDDAEAEDALQEAYLRAWRALGTFRADAKLSTWLVRIVINEALGRLRRRGAQVIVLDAALDGGDVDIESSLHDNPDDRPETHAMRAEVRGLLERRIDRLPEAFRTVFMLRAVEELSVEEVAAALQLPEATVRTRFFRARSLLREGLSRDIDLAIGEAFAFAGARCDRIVAAVLSRLPQAAADAARAGGPAQRDDLSG
jgi:RNA polymerase sigma-70 factor (ECF subfamily)